MHMNALVRRALADALAFATMPSPADGSRHSVRYHSGPGRCRACRERPVLNGDYKTDYDQAVLGIRNGEVGLLYADCPGHEVASTKRPAPPAANGGPAPSTQRL